MIAENVSFEMGKGSHSSNREGTSAGGEEHGFELAANI